jgi:hypothetical protein
MLETNCRDRGWLGDGCADTVVANSAAPATKAVLTARAMVRRGAVESSAHC